MVELLPVHIGKAIFFPIPFKEYRLNFSPIPSTYRVLRILFLYFFLLTLVEAAGTAPASERKKRELLPV
jgi:hypothetical protein